MRINLLENQIELILDSLEAYTKVSDKKQLIFATYNSILAQQISRNSVISSNMRCNEIVNKM